jgi:hypothetical protein
MQRDELMDATAPRPASPVVAAGDEAAGVPMATTSPS